MNDDTTVQDLNWPLLEAYISTPLNELPTNLTKRATASAFPVPWDVLSSGQRESLIKASDCPIDPETDVEFAAGFHGFIELVEALEITATKAAKALLTENRLLASLHDIDSLAIMLCTDEERLLNRAVVLHPLAEWLHRAQARGFTYHTSLDWAVGQSVKRVSPSGKPEKAAPPVQANRGITKQGVMNAFEGMVSVVTRINVPMITNGEGWH